MNFVEVGILSVVEGLTEFLPISSTGHLIIAAKILNIPQSEFVKTFTIVIQLGAILSVLVIYGPKFWKSKITYLNMLAAFLPTALVGFTLYKLIKNFLLGNTYITVASLFIGGIILIFLEKIIKPQNIKIRELEKINPVTAFIIGCFQSLSVIPGTSRAAATIVGGMYLGLDRKTAAEFSFILAVPTMMAATALDLIRSELKFSNSEIMVILTGIILSFICALISVKFLIKLTEKHSFSIFGIYRIILGILFYITYLA